MAPKYKKYSLKPRRFFGIAHSVVNDFILQDQMYEIELKERNRFIPYLCKAIIISNKNVAEAEYNMDKQKDEDNLISVLKRKYEWVPNIISYEQFVHHKRGGIIGKNPTEEWFWSGKVTSEIEVSNFESADRRFSGSTLIKESNQNKCMVVYPYRDETRILERLGYLSSDCEKLYPHFKVGDIFKVITRIPATPIYQPNRNIISYALYPTYGTSEPKKEFLIDSIPLLKNLEPGDTVMFLGFKKFDQPKEIKNDDNVFNKIKNFFVEKETPKQKMSRELMEQRKIFVPEWLIREKIVASVLPITYLEKIVEQK